jgi:DNA (cytosine-5)-methyltransferase 1
MKRDDFTLQLDLGHELVIDNFAGGGGTSTGLETALGRPVDIAINHDPEALAMHAINHPNTKHLLQSVWDVDPISVTGNQPVGLVWLSPDCKHFSKAKGGTPVSKHIRGLAWVGMRWVALTRPRVMMLENVEEFTDWGPLIVAEDGTSRPDPARKGVTFRSFVRQLKQHGYKVDWTERRACDSGAPTIRKRLFLIARRDGLPIRWPTPKYAAPDSRAVATGRAKPWRTAAECINFDTPAQSIFGRKRPLVENTLRRVAKGLWRHVLANDHPFIVSQSAPFICEHANASNQRTMPANEPLRTICAQVKGGHFSIVAPALAPLRGTSAAHMGGHSVEAPLSTVSAGGTHHALMAAHLVTIGYGERPGQEPRTHSCADPLGTVVAGGVKRALVSAAFLEQANGGYYDGDGRSLSEPTSTVTASGAQQRLVTAYMVKYYSSGGQWQGLAEPMHTLPTKGRMGLVQTVQVLADSLAPELLDRAKACAALLREFLPEQFQADADLVLVGDYVLIDITLRMLKPRELYRAQGFPESYVINEIPDPALLFKDGIQIDDPLSVPRIPLSGTAQVRMCGNSVSPPQAEDLVLANFAHEPAEWRACA